MCRKRKRTWRAPGRRQSSISVPINASRDWCSGPSPPAPKESSDLGQGRLCRLNWRSADARPPGVRSGGPAARHRRWRFRIEFLRSRGLDRGPATRVPTRTCWAVREARRSVRPRGGSSRSASSAPSVRPEPQRSFSNSGASPFGRDPPTISRHAHHTTCARGVYVSCRAIPRIRQAGSSERAGADAPGAAPVTSICGLHPYRSGRQRRRPERSRPRTSSPAVKLPVASSR